MRKVIVANSSDYKAHYAVDMLSPVTCLPTRSVLVYMYQSALFIFSFVLRNYCILVVYVRWWCGGGVGLIYNQMIVIDLWEYEYESLSIF